MASGHEDLLDGMELAAATEDKETHSFEIDPSQVMHLLQLESHEKFSVMETDV